MSEYLLWERFTIVFEGDIRKLPFNPLSKESDWGRPVAASAGDDTLRIDAKDEEIAELEAELWRIKPSMTSPQSPPQRFGDGTKEGTRE